ncbi:peroxiredoxin-like family protein [Bacteroidota bacterium]
MKKIISLFLILLASLSYAQNKVSTFKVGDPAPEFKGIDQFDNLIELKSLLAHGPVLLVFYRGYWCPHCNKHLSNLQDSLELITAKGVTVIAVTPESSESIEKTIEKTDASFHILFDKDHMIVKKYRLSFELKGPKKIAYKTWGINLEKINGEEDNILPVPATYLIGQDGIIKFLHYETDYTTRSSVKEILNSLNE